MVPQRTGNARGLWFFFFLALLAVAIAILILLIIWSVHDHHDHHCATFGYEIPFVCGRNPMGTPRLRAGDFRTLVHINNPNDDTATLWKKITLDFPPQRQEPGFVSEFLDEELDSCETVMVDCEEIFHDFGLRLRGLPPYIAGLVLVRSHDSLTVWAEQTVSAVPLIWKGKGHMEVYQEDNVTDIDSQLIFSNAPASLAVYNARERCVHR